MFDPEAIEVALFNLLQNAVTALPFKTISRHAKIWGNAVPPDQPALYLVPLGGPTVQDQAFGAPKYHLKYVVLIYARADAALNSTVMPQTLLNNAWKAINNAMLGKPIDPVQAAAWLPHGEKQTLGGLVENAWVDGETTMQAAILDQQGAIEIPLSALTGV
jgi:hypothetical protein